MGYSSGGGGLGGTSSSPPLGVQGTKALGKQVKQLWSPTYFEGDFATPIIRKLSQLVYNAGSTEATKERGRILSTPGLTSPAKAKMVSEAGTKAILGAAAVPMDIYKEASEGIGKLLGTTSVGFQKTKGTSGGGICGSCYILREANEGELELSLRLFRDAHFPPNGRVDQGYKWMSTWLIPMMRRSKSIKRVVRSIMLTPLCKVANWMVGRDDLGYLYIPFAYFWIGLWTVLGGISTHQFPQVTPRSQLSSYPTMTSSFIMKFKEGSHGTILR